MGWQNIPISGDSLEKRSYRYSVTWLQLFIASITANAVDVVGKDLSCYRKREPIICQEQVLDGKMSEKCSGNGQCSETSAGENSLYSGIIIVTGMLMVSLTQEYACVIDYRGLEIVSEFPV